MNAVQTRVVRHQSKLAFTALDILPDRSHLKTSQKSSNCYFELALSTHQSELYMILQELSPVHNLHTTTERASSLQFANLINSFGYKEDYGDVHSLF